MSEEDNSSDWGAQMRQFLSALGDEMMFINPDEEEKNSEELPEKRSVVELPDENLSEIRNAFFNENSIFQQFMRGNIREEGDASIRDFKREDIPSEIGEFNLPLSYVSFITFTKS